MDNVILMPGQFLSTLSLRRATFGFAAAPQVILAISIHALLAESDLEKALEDTNKKLFLSTLSLRRATHQR